MLREASKLRSVSIRMSFHLGTTKSKLRSVGIGTRMGCHPRNRVLLEPVACHRMENQNPKTSALLAVTYTATCHYGQAKTKPQWSYVLLYL
jgi:hypothetical protein